MATSSADQASISSAAWPSPPPPLPSPLLASPSPLSLSQLAIGGPRAGPAQHAGDGVLFGPAWHEKWSSMLCLGRQRGMKPTSAQPSGTPCPAWLGPIGPCLVWARAGRPDRMLIYSQMGPIILRATPKASIYFSYS